MDTFLRMVSLFFEELGGRVSGPLNFRLVVMPTMAALFGIRAGLRDAREGKPTFLWGILTQPAGRTAAFQSAVKDVGKVFVMAVIMDTAYQLIALHGLRLLHGVDRRGVRHRAVCPGPGPGRLHRARRSSKTGWLMKLPRHVRLGEWTAGMIAMLGPAFIEDLVNEAVAADELGESHG